MAQRVEEEAPIPRSSRSVFRSLAGREKQRRDVLRMWASAQLDCLWLERVEPGGVCRVAGVVERLRLDPGAGAVEATITDGSSVAIARWPLRRPVEQLAVTPGAGLVLDGIAQIDAVGRLLFVEPEWQVVAGPGKP